MNLRFYFQHPVHDCLRIAERSDEAPHLQGKSIDLAFLAPTWEGKTVCLRKSFYPREMTAV
jgi:hypothetical protein